MLFLFVYVPFLVLFGFFKGVGKIGDIEIKLPHVYLDAAQFLIEFGIIPCCQLVGLVFDQAEGFYLFRR